MPNLITRGTCSSLMRHLVHQHGGGITWITWLFPANLLMISYYWRTPDSRTVPPIATHGHELLKRNEGLIRNLSKEVTKTCLTLSIFEPTLFDLVLSNFLSLLISSNLLNYLVAWSYKKCLSFIDHHLFLANAPITFYKFHKFNRKLVGARRGLRAASEIISLYKNGYLPNAKAF